jgi:hypothetical protein
MRLAIILALAAALGTALVLLSTRKRPTMAPTTAPEDRSRAKEAILQRAQERIAQLLEERKALVAKYVAELERMAKEEAKRTIEDS